MESAEVVAALVSVIVALAGIGGFREYSIRKNGNHKNGNPGVVVHLVKLESLGEQQVSALGDMKTELRDMGKELTLIHTALGRLDGTVGSCNEVQQLRRRG